MRHRGSGMSSGYTEDEIIEALRLSGLFSEEDISLVLRKSVTIEQIKGLIVEKVTLSSLSSRIEALEMILKLIEEDPDSDEMT
jgi:hypothetical protein